MQTELSPKSKENVVRQVRQLMDFWSISQSELERAWKDGPANAKTPAAPTVKYRHPVTADTWDGHGEHPQWLRQALLKDGYTVAQLRPENQPDVNCENPSSEPSPT